MENTLADRLIARSDVRAERLISILRMTLATMLFAGVSVLLFQAEAMGLDARRFELRWLLAGAVCYFMIGAVNFYFATPERLRPWMIWAFNLAEVLLVSFQLYIDVADPRTPSLHAFASPVVLVAALVICVQALRFQIRLHIFTTVLLIALCAAILLHDPQIGTPLSPVAAQELDLVYSGPPNVMRMLMLAAMALLIGLAVVRSRQLVESVARETEMAQNRNRFLPPEIATRMSDTDLGDLRAGEETELAVLFADVRGFTALAESLGPRETAAFLGQFRGLMTQAVSRHGGFIDKFIGDGALAIFGLHSDLSAASKAALQAAQDALKAVEDWNEVRSTQGLAPVRIAIGLHAGPAMIGAIGDAERLEFTALGNTVNIASRLEDAAKRNCWRLAVSATAADAAGLERGDFTEGQDVTLRGLADPLPVLALR